MKVLSLGAGVQSSTLYIMSSNGDLPLLDCAIFADTQTEPSDVYKYLDYLQNADFKHKIPIYIVTAGNLEEDAREWAAGGDRGIGLPLFTSKDGGGILPRQCTQNYKIAPVRRKIRELRGDSKDVVELWIGISVDEIERMKPSGVKYIEHSWPLIDKRMSRSDCLSCLEYNGYPLPAKSACYHCPFRSDASWASMKKNKPELFDRAVDLDKTLRVLPRIRSETYLHRSMKPLDEVVFEDEDQMDMFVNECTGYCGL